MLELWLQPVDAASVSWATAQSAVLDDGEAQRWQRYRSDESRDLFLVAHVVTRFVLSNYDNRGPEEWRFDQGAQGRPEIADGPEGLRFNISHTEGMVAVVIHGNADCGVDVEHPWRETDLAGVSRRVFTDAEREAIFALPLDQQANRFFCHWTLKEAFIKAKGAGFAMPLRRFSFSHGSDGAIGFDCDPSIDPDPWSWEFFTNRLASGHIVSVAAQGGSRGNRSLTQRHLDLGPTGY